MNKNTIEIINQALSAYLDEAKLEMDRRYNTLCDATNELGMFMGKKHDSLTGYDIIDRYNELNKLIEVHDESYKCALSHVQSIEESIEEFNQMTGGEF